MAGHQEWLYEILRHPLIYKICWFAVPVHAWFSFPHFFWIFKLGMNWTTHAIHCRCTQGARASEHLTLSKWDLWQERRHCEDQVGCLAFVLCLCHFCMLVLPFRQMDLSNFLRWTSAQLRLGQTPTFIFSRWVLALCGPHLGAWERLVTLPLLKMGVAEDAAKFLLFREYTLSISIMEFLDVHTCLLQLGNVTK